jgi:Flp pilus assembly protein TadD
MGRVWLERAAAGGGRTALGQALRSLQGGVNSESSSEALTLLGRALAMSGDLARAEQVLDQATSRFPVDPEAFRYLAEVAGRRGRVSVSERALLDYAALVRNESLSGRLLARIGQAHMGRGDMQAARAAIGHALDKEPANSVALRLKGRLEQ